MLALSMDFYQFTQSPLNTCKILCLPHRNELVFIPNRRDNVCLECMMCKLYVVHSSQSDSRSIKLEQVNGFNAWHRITHFHWAMAKCTTIHNGIGSWCTLYSFMLCILFCIAVHLRSVRHWPCYNKNKIASSFEHLFGENVKGKILSH